MMPTSSVSERSEYKTQLRVGQARRDGLNRALRLLRQLQQSIAAGDAVPPLKEILSVTGLPHPGITAIGPAVDALIQTATAEREAVNRRLRLARALNRATEEIEEAQDEPTVEDTRVPVPAPAAPARPTLRPEPTPWAGEAERLGRLSSRDLDQLPYGAILMDTGGRVIAYNDTESRMARLPVEAVLGRNFFTEVAPCTRVKEFEGRFRALASGEGAQVCTFDFEFPFPFGAQRVSVILTRGSAPGTVIMALLRR